MRRRRRRLQPKAAPMPSRGRDGQVMGVAENLVGCQADTRGKSAVVNTNVSRKGAGAAEESASDFKAGERGPTG